MYFTGTVPKFLNYFNFFSIVNGNFLKKNALNKTVIQSREKCVSQVNEQTRNKNKIIYLNFYRKVRQVNILVTFGLSMLSFHFLRRVASFW